MSATMKRWMARVGSLVAAATLAACGGGGGDADGGQGTLRVSLTDAPGCYEHVYVTVEKVRVHASGSAADADAGWRDLVLDAPKRIDLLTLTNGVLEELGSTALPAGNYSQLRLVLAENSGSDPLANAVQPAGGALVPLRTPSAQQSGLKLQVNFEVEADRTIDLVLDFDACKSVVRAGNSGNYNLKPVVSVTPKYTSSIQGYVSTTMTLSATTVSAQQGGVPVRATSPDADGKFVLAFLPDGTYTLVITSQGRATGVVTGVPVGTTAGVTRVNGTATAVILPVSAMRSVSGSVTTTRTVGGSTTTVPLTDASVAAMQTVASTKVEIASTAVDLDLGTYTMHLPAAAPVRAPYATSGLRFTADAAAAGNYRLRATSPGRTAQERAIDVDTGNVTADFGFAP